ncbi:MAG: DUF502 domain-containing protein [Proteobacteria bacterium]|nr:DUF502 domain-containing protein [Pseudomonadota bacterium]
MNLRSFGRIFFTGLAAVLPLAVTVAILWWLLSGMERVLGQAVMWLIPNAWYIPGMGILLGLVIIFAIGLLARAWLFRKIFNVWDAAFSRIPLVKTVYGAVQDFMKFISGGAGKNFDRVVMVEVDGIRLVGFVTCEDSLDLPNPLGDDDRIAVYFPMSYQIGGYTLFLPRSRVTPVDMGMETAMRFVVTAGLSGGKNDSR